MFIQDILVFSRWWLTILIIGISFTPLTSLIFDSFNDKGYLFSKTIGIAISGYILWLLSSLHILKFSSISGLLILLICIIINLTIFYKNPKIFTKDIMKTWIVEEVCFLIIFVIFLYIKGFKPEAYGTEKFMDFGFMTSLMRNDYMPPEDFWFAGNNLNYYYLGQYFSVFITKLSFLEVKYTYNLMLIMIAALSCMLSYSIVYNISYKISKLKDVKRKTIPVLSGLIASLAIVVAGNMHYTIFKWISPFINKIRRMDIKYRYWFPDSSRYIGYFPETNDKTIHEFPSYSFILGDLHAHVINIIFVLTLIGVLFSWINIRDNIKSNFKKGNINYKKEVFLNPKIITIGFLIGLFHMTNFWDFPIYYIVSGAVILFSNIMVYNYKRDVIKLTLIQGIFIMGISKIISLPFTMKFDKIASRIMLAEDHTPFYQWMVLWGLPVIVVLFFITFIILDLSKKKGRLQDILYSSDLFVILLGLCAIGLLLIPEIVYVEDIYKNYKRANTMFKLTYQAFILFGICFGYIFTRIIGFSKNIKIKAIMILFVLCFSSTLLFSINASNNWFGNIFDYREYKSLDASKYIADKMPDDDLPIKWINKNIKDRPVLLEANGESYSNYQRISVNTGLPTVLGWEVHEWLWRSDYGIIAERIEDIEDIYTNNDIELVKSLIDKYNISYIYIGKLEIDKFGSVNHSLLKSMGEVIYILNPSLAKEYQTYIIKMN
ncbi:MAG TPA: hypothetical protein GXZ90_10315 [Clostridiales bacterium]|nr:hypothetical protein [Clostridiales bacterium]